MYAFTKLIYLFLKRSFARKHPTRGVTSRYCQQDKFICSRSRCFSGCHWSNQTGLPRFDKTWKNVFMAWDKTQYELICILWSLSDFRMHVKLLDDISTNFKFQLLIFSGNVTNLRICNLNIILSMSLYLLMLTTIPPKHSQ